MYQRIMMTRNEKIFLIKLISQSYSQVFDFYSQSFIEPNKYKLCFQFEEDSLQI